MRAAAKVRGVAGRFGWVAVMLSACASPESPEPPPFEVHEATVQELRGALDRGEVTSVQLVESYLERIEAYDRNGPALRAILHIHPAARGQAEALDAERLRGESRGPLHGIPVLLKDNFDTADLPTTGGSVSLAGAVPEEDGTVVRRLREAGAIILAKTNLHEFAFGYTTVSSLGGQTLNPHDPTRNPGGSSGGTGAAIAASMGAVGYGTDTCGSIRIPASANGIWGIRPTRGLVSLTGVLPLSLTQDAAGPLARSAADLVVALAVIAGPDPRDPITSAQEGRSPMRLDPDVPGSELAGARFGVVPEFFGSEPDEEVVSAAVRAALAQMAEAGAELVEAAIPGLDTLLAGTSVITREFRRDLDAYLAGRPAGTVRSLAEIVEGGGYAPAVAGVLSGALASSGVETAEYQEILRRQVRLRETVLAWMDNEGVDALAYPPMRRLPAPIGEPQGGVNCQLAAATGMPALVVPAGMSAQGVPVGLELLARPFEEDRLLGWALEWESLAPPRLPPPTTPPL